MLLFDCMGRTVLASALNIEPARPENKRAPTLAPGPGLRPMQAGGKGGTSPAVEQFHFKLIRPHYGGNRPGDGRLAASNCGHPRRWTGHSADKASAAWRDCSFATPILSQELRAPASKRCRVGLFAKHPYSLVISSIRWPRSRAPGRQHDSTNLPAHIDTIKPHLHGTVFIQK